MNRLNDVKKAFENDIKNNLNMNFKENKALIEKINDEKISEVNNLYKNHENKESIILDRKEEYIDFENELNRNDYYTDYQVSELNKRYEEEYDLKNRSEYLTFAKSILAENLEDDYDKAAEVLSELEAGNEEQSNDYPVIYGLTTHERLSVNEFDKNLDFVTNNKHYSVLLDESNQELISQAEFRRAYENSYNPDNSNIEVLQNILDSKNAQAAKEFNDFTLKGHKLEKNNTMEME